MLSRSRAGTSPDIVAKNLRMSPEDEEFAHTCAFFFPDTLAKIEQEAEARKKRDRKRRADMLTEAFQFLEAGHKLDPMNPELLYWPADSYYWGCGFLF
jgi:hypothetical protein